VAVREFPALGSDPAPGDPTVLSSAAADVRAAGTVFSDASANVSRLNSSAWTGDAADAFRGQLEQFDDKVAITLDSPACTLSCTAIAVYVQNISAYQSA
jgi:hypothetical protein